MRTKRILASLLALLMLFALLPAAALAEEPEAAEAGDTKALPPVDEPELKELGYGYYLIGRAEDDSIRWTTDGINEADLFQQNYSASTTEYKLRTTLVEGERLKVVLVSNLTQLGPWYPEEEGTEYVVDSDHAGDRIIYFRPGGNAEWSAFGGYMYIDSPPTYNININQPANGYLSADKTTAPEGDPVTVTAYPNPGYYPAQQMSARPYPSNTSWPDDFHFSFTMPNSDVTVSLGWNQFCVDAGYYYSVETNVMDLTPADKFQPVNSPFGEYVFETVLVEGQYISLEHITTDRGWDHDPSSPNPEVTEEMAGHVKVFLSETEKEGGIKVYEVYRWISGVKTLVLETWMTIKYAHPITVDPGAPHGTVSAPTEAFAGDTVNLSVTPDPGYELDTFTVTDENGNPVPVNGTAFTMPDSPVTVMVTFKPAVMYTVTVLGSVPGCTVVSDKDSATEGETVTLTVTNDNDHRLVSIEAADENGGPVALEKIPNSYTRYRFTMPASNVTVTAVSKEIYPLTLVNTQVDSLNCGNILGDGSAVYDPETRTLSFTSTDPAFGTAYGNALIYWTGTDPLTIEAPAGGLHLTGNTTYCISSSMDAGEVVVNGDLILDIPEDSNGVWVNLLTINGNVSGTVKAIALFGQSGVTVNGSVNVTNQDAIRTVVTNTGSVTITGDFTAVGCGIDAPQGITVGGNVVITASAGTTNYALQSSGGPVSVGGSFSFSGKGQYAVNAAGGFSCAGDVTVLNNSGRGIYASGGPITVGAGTWDVQAVSDPLKAAGGISIPATHAITLPEGGVLGELADGGTTWTVVYEADGTTRATHVILSPTSQEETVTVIFNACGGTVSPESAEIPAGGTLSELPVPVREGWTFLGWFTAAAETAFDAGEGTQVTLETTFPADAAIYAHWYLPGDVNGNGEVDNKDVTWLMRYVKYQDVTVVERAVNVNGEDGVDNKDVTWLMRYVKYHDVTIH